MEGPSGGTEGALARLLDASVFPSPSGLHHATKPFVCCYLIKAPPPHWSGGSTSVVRLSSHPRFQCPTSLLPLLSLGGSIRAIFSSRALNLIPWALLTASRVPAFTGSSTTLTIDSYKSGDSFFFHLRCQLSTFLMLVPSITLLVSTFFVSFQSPSTNRPFPCRNPSHSAIPLFWRALNRLWYPVSPQEDRCWLSPIVLMGFGGGPGKVEDSDSPGSTTDVIKDKVVGNREKENKKQA